MTRALIVGAAGQDGSYLAELLLAGGDEVLGILRPGSAASPRLSAVRDKIRLIEADLTDAASVDRAISEAKPDEVYNFAAQSFMPVTWKEPALTGEVMGRGAARLLESLLKHAPKARFYQASSAEMFGRPARSPQNEETPLSALNPYAEAKIAAHRAVVGFRERGLFAVSGFCFNHESPRRAPVFVTRKITRAAAAIKLGLASELRMGDLAARRDWGFAGDYVDAMRRMLRADRPEDFVIATGVARSVQDFAAAAFDVVGLDWRKHVIVDESLRREPEAVERRGDPSKARRQLGWEPRVGFPALVESMVRWDLECLRAGRADAVDAPWTPPPDIKMIA
jgi:GDPmannose 4,6-dehydratase